MTTRFLCFGAPILLALVSASASCGGSSDTSSASTDPAGGAAAGQGGGSSGKGGGSASAGKGGDAGHGTGGGGAGTGAGGKSAAAGQGGVGGTGGGGKAGSGTGGAAGTAMGGAAGTSAAGGAAAGQGGSGIAGAGGDQGAGGGQGGAGGDQGGAGGDQGGAGGDTGGMGGGSGGSAGAAQDDLTSNRQRLLQSYLDFLKAFATTPQSNGLSGSNVSSACDLWMKLDPSSQAVFLTLTARMQGSILGIDGSSMLSHVVKVYRIVGGQDATATDPGSCGGGEYNRMIMSMDAELHDSQLAASSHKGALQPNGKYDIKDAPAGTFWRDSHDLGGAHSPFDISDETDQGAPRGQTQYFQDPTKAPATSPLGRMDLGTLVDPYALEMDQDYDCVHNSNPSCDYVTYGPLCFPETSLPGTAVYQKTYGDFDAGWMPTCN